MEMWDLLGPGRKPTGRLVERSRRDLLGPDEYHLIVEIWTVDEEGKILLTLRHPGKEFPLMWEVTGGSVLAGETSLSGACRELREETGLSAREDQLYLFFARQEVRAFLDSYLYRAPRGGEITLQPGETVDFMWVSWEQLMDMHRRGLIAPHTAGRLSVYADQLKNLIKPR